MFKKIILSTTILAVLNLSFVQLTFAAREASTAEKIDALEVALDAASPEFEKMDQEVAQLKESSKYLRWSKILSKKSSRVLGKLNELAEKQSDAEREQSLQVWKEKAEFATDLEMKKNILSLLGHEGNSRQKIQDLNAYAVPVVLDHLALQIAKVGGAIPFMLHLKSNLQAARAGYGKTHSPAAQRSIASLNDGAWCWEMFLFLGGIVIFGVAAASSLEVLGYVGMAAVMGGLVFGLFDPECYH